MKLYHKRTYRQISETGEKIEFVSEIRIHGDGKFYFTFIKDIEYIVKLDRDIGYCQICDTKYGLTLVSNNYERCHNIISRACKEFIKSDIKKERVILYKFFNNTSYVKNLKGEIFSNGNDKNADFNKGGVWCGNLDMTNRHNYYSIGLVVGCYDKVIYSSLNNNKVEYQYNDNYDDKYWCLINSFTGLNINSKECKELLYTEQRAKFFYDFMISICKLADKIDTFFNDEEMFLNVINSGNNTLFFNSKSEDNNE